VKGLPQSEQRKREPSAGREKPGTISNCVGLKSRQQIEPDTDMGPLAQLPRRDTAGAGRGELSEVHRI
jgi:hypothetical protein